MYHWDLIERMNWNDLTRFRRVIARCISSPCHVRLVRKTHLTQFMVEDPQHISSDTMLRYVSINKMYLDFCKTVLSSRALSRWQIYIGTLKTTQSNPNILTAYRNNNCNKTQYFLPTQQKCIY